jgi:hypothetical protein
MHTLLAQFAANPIPFAIAAVVAVLALIGVWKLGKGGLRVVLILVLIAAIVGVFAWMAKGGPLPF